MLRRRTVTAGCALAISVLTLMSTPALADRAPAASTTAQKPPPAMVEAMQRDLGITVEQVESRLLNESRLSGTENKIRKTLTDDYAGSWLSGPTSSTLTVATSDAAAAVSITGAGVKAKVVEHSLIDLNTTKDALDKVAGQAPKSTPVWYVDVQSNSVVVLSSQPAEAEAFIAASGVDKSTVRVEQSSEQPKALYDLRGGDAYYISNLYRCSIGFSVTKGSQNGFVSAGHCGTAGETTTGYNDVAQGTFQGSSFPTNDYSWVAVNSNWTPQGWVNDGNGGNVGVAGSTVAVVGASICRSGSTTGWHCGTVQQLNTSVTYAEGTIYEVTRTNVCAEPGDSGGSYISGSQAQGVTSGGSGNCTSGGTTYFQPVNEILSTYGLTLKTDSGTPPPPACSGYEQTFTGSLTSGSSAYQPNGSSYTTTVSGTHTACLDGPSGTDFDIYLQKRSGSSWVTVAQGITTAPDESISYNGTAGTYRYRIHAYSGSGSYTMGMSTP